MKIGGFLSYEFLDKIEHLRTLSDSATSLLIVSFNHCAISI